jgi:hypothetical protein
MVSRMASNSGIRSVDSSPPCFAPGAMRHAGLGVGVEDGEVELVFGGFEIDKEIVDFVEHGGGTGIGAVDLVQHDDGLELGMQRLLQHVARLRQRAFAGVHEQNYAIHHAQRAFDFTAEIAVAGRVHDIDARVVVEKGSGFRKDGDAALAFEFVGVHHARHQYLIAAEDAALAEHGVNQRGLAVVNVGDDGDVTDRRKLSEANSHSLRAWHILSYRSFASESEITARAPALPSNF